MGNLGLLPLDAGTRETGDEENHDVLVVQRPGRGGRAFLRLGAPSICGWLTDKYGLSWQVIPRKLKELIFAPDRERANCAMHAMLQMKIDVAALQRAFDGD